MQQDHFQWAVFAVHRAVCVVSAHIADNGLAAASHSGPPTGRDNRSSVSRGIYDCLQHCRLSVQHGNQKGEARH